MRSSLVGRVTLAYVALAGALVVGTCFASTAFALHQAVYRVQGDLARRRADIVLTANELEKGGRPFTNIARVIAGEPRAGVSIDVFDSRGNLIAGSPPTRRALKITRIGALLGVGPYNVPIPGGSVRITYDLRKLFGELRAYMLFNLPIALIAIAFAWWAGRRITLRAMRPVSEMTTALNELAAGDFSEKAFLTLDHTEIATLVEAFNRASAAVARAMTDRDRAESELRQFVADAGHELRTPMTTIIGYVDALKNSIVADPAIAREILDTVGGEGQRMRRIVEDLVTLARLDHQSSSRKDVVALRDIVLEVFGSIPSQERTRLRDGGGDAIVFADATAIHRALRNVVDNALRYTRGDVDVHAAREGAMALLTVQDRGPGMNDSELRMAFERFQRGHHGAEIEGTGLGLAIVKSAVEGSGGSVTLASSPQEGTTVCLRLPLATASHMRVEGHPIYPVQTS